MLAVDDASSCTGELVGVHGKVVFGARKVEETFCTRRVREIILYEEVRGDILHEEVRGDILYEWGEVERGETPYE